MSSLIANKVKTNLMFSFCFSLRVLSALSYVPLFNFVPSIQQQFICSLYFFLFMLAILLTQLFARSLQRRSFNHDCFVHTQLHTSQTEFLLLVACIVLPLLYALVISLMKVLEVEHSGLCLFDNSIAITFLFVFCVHSAFDCIRIFVYPFFSPTVVVGLLVISSFYVLV